MERIGRDWKPQATPVEVWTAETSFRFGCTVSEAKRAGWMEGAAKAESCLPVHTIHPPLTAASDHTLANLESAGVPPAAR